MEIFEKIAKLRASLGLSRDRFSEAVNISVNTIRAIETKGVTPKSDVLEKISRAWPCYSLWLLTGEDAPLSGQLTPRLDANGSASENTIFQVVDVIGRDIDSSIAKAEVIEKVTFLQTCDAPFSLRSERLLTTTSYHRGKFASSIPVGDSNFGTGMMLVLRGRTGAGFKRVVLVEDGYFDLREIEQKGGIFGLLGDYQNWLSSNGIRQFDIAGVHPKTLWAACTGMDELRAEDLYPAPSDVEKSFSMWCESF